MTKSKIIKANEKIAGKTSPMGFKRSKIPLSAVMRKIEDRFIENYLTRDGETIEEAKKTSQKRTKSPGIPKNHLKLSLSLKNETFTKKSEGLFSVKFSSKYKFL